MLTSVPKIVRPHVFHTRGNDRLLGQDIAVFDELCEIS